MTTKTENFDKVYKHINDNHVWDDIYMDITDDEDGDMYIIVDSHDDIKKLTEVVRDVLNLEDEDIWLDDVLGVEVVFNDEYTTCSDCNKVIRVSPDSYSWKPDYYVGDGFIACNKCFNDTEDYKEGYVQERVNNPQQANTILDDEQLRLLGFERMNGSYEAGLHEGQNDNPQIIYDELEDRYDEVLFSIDGVGQFDTSFSVWVRGRLYEGDDE